METPNPTHSFHTKKLQCFPPTIDNRQFNPNLPEIKRLTTSRTSFCSLRLLWTDSQEALFLLGLQHKQEQLHKVLIAKSFTNKPKLQQQ